MRSLRTPFALAVAACAAVAVVPALAQDLPQTRIVSTARATPSKAGTAKAPRGVGISASAKLLVPGDVEAPIVTGMQILVGKGLVWNAGRYATCAKAVLDRRGPSGCPPASIMGSATATGKADTVDARVDVTIVNAGDHHKYAYATLNNPARVRETVVIDSSTPSGGPWGHRESFKIPRSLQIVAGVPLQLTAVTLRIGGKSYAKDFIASTSCPRGGWKYQVTADELYNDSGQTAGVVSTGSIPCTK